jgi:acyl dehydratase
MQMLSPKAAKALIGADLGTSDWFLIDQEMVNRFADLTNDHQFIHVKPDAAKMTPFGGTIVHGFLRSSQRMLSELR